MIQHLTPELEAAVRALAYAIWEQEGRPEGRHEQHWHRAYDAIVNVPLMMPAAQPERAAAKKKAAAKKRKT